MNDIDYRHDRNLHSLEGAARGLSYLLHGRRIDSLLDVGAGTGTWLHAARQAGVKESIGVDGVPAENRQVWVDPKLIKTVDLRKPFDLARRFDAVLCLEVAEHLPSDSARTLIASLCRHSDLVFFSAAIPGQHGDGHINCQWPVYWQTIFNEMGYVCHDDLRPNMWPDREVEAWYRQNVFTAVCDPQAAGLEDRIRGLVHPELTEHTDLPNSPLVKLRICLDAGIFHPTYFAKLFLISIRRHVARLLAHGR